MIDKLKQIEEKVLLDLLSKPNEWKTLFIDYHPPVVERIWAQIGNYRLYLHFIHPCEAKDALFHPHPWPSAMHVLTGEYEMSLGYGPGLVEPPKMCTILVENGGMYYDMTDIDGWHSVRPVKTVCATAMLTGKKWNREEIKSNEPLKPMTEERKMLMLQFFSTFYKKLFQSRRVITNAQIQQGDWVKIDEKIMHDHEKRGFEKYFDDIAFVVKRNGGLLDIRFKKSNDRIQMHLGVLSLLDPKDKIVKTDIVDKVEPQKEDIPFVKKHEDDMHPDNWKD
jgi:hypothetical protein